VTVAPQPHADDTATPDSATDEAATDETVAEIGAKAGRGLSWSLVGTLVLKVGNFAVSLVVARLLLPADYGVYAVALAVMYFLMHVNDVGLIAATIQWRGRIEEMAATASTMALAFSGAFYAAFWFLAEPFARLAGVPEAAGVIRVLTLVIVIDGVTAVRAGVIMRDFRQNKLIQANAAGFVVTAVLTIGLAAAGSGPYSFAWGNVAGAAVTGALVMAWGRVPFRFGLDRAIARRLLVYGLPLAAALGVEAIVMNADYVIVGNILGEDSVGFYLMAFNISSWIPGIVGTAVRYVSLAGFSRLSEKDPAALQAGVERSAALLVTGLVPMVVLIGVLAGPLISVLYGSRWLPSAPVLQVLMLFTMVTMLTMFALDILAGAGATRPSLWVYLCWAVAVVPALWLGTQWRGTVGAATAHVVVGVLVALPVTGLALQRAGVRLRPVVRRVVRPLLAGALTTAVCLLVAQIPGPALVQITVTGLFGLAVFVATGVAPDDRRLMLDRLAPLADKLARLRGRGVRAPS
jgi:PST family polysaccharide transporter